MRGVSSRQEGAGAGAGASARGGGGGIKDEACYRCGIPECSFDPDTPSLSVVHERGPHFLPSTTNSRGKKDAKDSHRRSGKQSAVKTKPPSPLQPPNNDDAGNSGASRALGGRLHGMGAYKTTSRDARGLRVCQTFLRKVASSTRERCAAYLLAGGQLQHVVAVNAL